MLRRQLLWGLVPVLWSLTATRARGAQQLSLLTPEDLRLESEALARAGLTANAAADEQWRVGPRAGPGAPQILIRSPAGPVRAPFSIQVEFAPAEGARIDLPTLRVRYGYAGIDVTNRIREFAQMGPLGFTVLVEAIPAGRHDFEVSIADTLMRSTRRRLHCEVLE